jgi:hypothetical protein
MQHIYTHVRNESTHFQKKITRMLHRVYHAIKGEPILQGSGDLPLGPVIRARVELYGTSVRWGHQVMQYGHKQRGDGIKHCRVNEWPESVP